MIERIESAQVGNAERSQRCQAQAHAVFHDVVNSLSAKRSYVKSDAAVNSSV